MKYIIYLTTNLKSSCRGLNKIYIGVHQTENPDIFDGYLGSGVYANQPSTFMYPKTPFQFAVKKYGVKSFVRNTLYVFNSKEEAYAKEAEIVTVNFIRQSHVYNYSVGGLIGSNGKPLYQFDLDGNLKKVWKYAIDAYEFYGYSKARFDAAIKYKRRLLDCYWSRTKELNLSGVKKGKLPRITYLYNKDGKLLSEFISEAECASYLKRDEATVVKSIKQTSLIAKEYYVSNSVVDEFKPKARREWSRCTFYVYDINNKYYGCFTGKKVMPIINLHSWKKIKNALVYNHGWYLNFYLSLEEIKEVPEKQFGAAVDVYTKYGEFVETLPSLAKVREKYDIKACEVKHIMQGDKFIKNWIFKYHSK